MSNIIEDSDFPEDIPLLEVGTQVLGGEGGPANWQAKVLANRTRYLKDKVENLTTNSVRSVNNKRGTVVLDASDVNADAAGTAQSLLTAHVDETDPHPQYLDQVRGDGRYLLFNDANKSNGWLQLDVNGKIPITFLQSLTSRHITVANQTDRLALPVSANLTICAQADIDTIFYLNGGLDPSVASNWITGQSATVSGVSSTFGRTGVITAEIGDYNADQITETATRKFVSSTEKSAWNAKQDKLVSGTSIKTIYGQQLLGSGDLTFTLTQLGAAAQNHDHTTTNITDYIPATKALIMGSLEAGQNVTLNQNPATGRTVISASGGGSGGGNGYMVGDRPNSSANENHVFYFSNQSAFNMSAFALKELAGALNQTYIIDSFTDDTLANYSATSDVLSGAGLGIYSGETYGLMSVNGFFEHDVRMNGKKINLSSVAGSIVPPMSSNTVPSGYVISSKSIYNSSYPAYYAFAEGLTNTQSAWISGAVPGGGVNSQWLQVDLPQALPIDEYIITNRRSGGIAAPNSWQLLGSNDGGVNWTVLHTVTGDTNATAGAIRKFTPTVKGAFKTYRIDITQRNGSDAFVAIYQLKLNFTNSLLIKDKNSEYWTAANGTLTKVTAPAASADFATKGFANSGDILEASLTDLKPIKVVGGYTGNVVSKSQPKNQIAVQRQFVSGEMWDKILSSSLLTTVTNTGQGKIAVSKDKSEWFVYRNNAWTSIGTLTVNEAGANTLSSQGMTPTEYGAITDAQWVSFFNPATDPGLVFAYSLSLPADGDNIVLTRNSLNVNESSSWRVQSASEVAISFRRNNVVFKPTTAGNYKFCYQLPSI